MWQERRRHHVAAIAKLDHKLAILDLHVLRRAATGRIPALLLLVIPACAGMTKDQGLTALPATALTGLRPAFAGQALRAAH